MVRFPRRSVAVPLIEAELRALPALAPRLPLGQGDLLLQSRVFRTEHLGSPPLGQRGPLVPLVRIRLPESNQSVCAVRVQTGSAPKTIERPPGVAPLELHIPQSQPASHFRPIRLKRRPVLLLGSLRLSGQ